jgi:tRNA pseudouridine38-40 synthase
MLALAMRLKLTIQYDGTDYHGWQVQAGFATVQGCIESAVASVQGEHARVFGAGRTDAGVHAYGQVAHVDVVKSLPAHTWLRALNANLPRDIRVFDVEEADGEVHARMSARGKHYRYRVWTGRVVSPFHRRYVHHAPHPLDFDAMAHAATLLVGRHDFEAFTVADRETKTTVRDLRRLDLDANGDILDLNAEADGFLRAMVRTLAGTLLAVGDGHMTAEGVARALDSKKRGLAGPTAPAPGLTLVRVDY